MFPSMNCDPISTTHTCSSKGECGVMVGVCLLVDVNSWLKGPRREGTEVLCQVGGV